MTRSRMDRWAVRWARWASKDSGPKFSIWFLLAWGIVFMVLAARSSASSGVIFMTGLMLVMGAWHQFERLGFIGLLEEARGQCGEGDDPAGSRSADRSHSA